jgi:hypothetical protein
MLDAVADALFSWALNPVAPLLSLVVSVIYFFSSPTSQPLGQRVLASSHGAAISLLYGAAIGAALSGATSQRLAIPFVTCAVGIPSLLAFVSIELYRGRLAIHWLQLLNLLSLAPALSLEPPRVSWRPFGLSQASTVEA